MCPKNTGRANVCAARVHTCKRPRVRTRSRLDAGPVPAYGRSHACKCTRDGAQTQVEIISAFAFHRPRRATTSARSSHFPCALSIFQLGPSRRYIEASIPFRRVTRDRFRIARALHHRTRRVESMCARVPGV